MVVISREEEVKKVAEVRAALAQANKIHEGQHRNLEGELLQFRSRMHLLQDGFTAYRLFIANLESKLSALSLKSLNAGGMATGTTSHKFK